MRSLPPGRVRGARPPATSRAGPGQAQGRRKAADPGTNDQYCSADRAWLMVMVVLVKFVTLIVDTLHSEMCPLLCTLRLCKARTDTRVAWGGPPMTPQRPHRTGCQPDACAGRKPQAPHSSEISRTRWPIRGAAGRGTRTSDADCLSVARACGDDRPKRERCGSGGSLELIHCASPGPRRSAVLRRC